MNHESRVINSNPDVTLDYELNFDARYANDSRNDAKYAP